MPPSERARYDVMTPSQRTKMLRSAKMHRGTGPRT
jgi:hypothetical protein